MTPGATALPDPIEGIGPLGVRVVGDSGPVVVLIHGLGRVAATWRDVAALTRDEVRLVLPDNPGLGRSSALKVPWSMIEHARLHIATLDALGLPPPYHLAGLSLGGMIAPTVADLLGERCASVTLLAASSRESGFWRLSLGSLMRMAGRSLATRSFDHRVNMPELVRATILEARPGLAKELDELQEREGFSAWNGFKQLLVAARWSIASHVPGLPARRLVVVGSDDRLVPPSNSHRLAKIIDAQLEVLDGRGHDMSVDSPDEVARILIEVARG